MKYMKPLNLFRDLLKRNARERGRLLGLDVGDKYVGLAVSDPDNKIASPLSVLIRKKTNMHLVAEDLQRMSVQVKIFIDDLCKTGKLEGVKYTFWDECFTSKNVELLIKPLKLPPTLSKTITDKFAAVGILQDYLDHLHRRAELEKW